MNKSDIAIIGLGVHYPDALTVQKFWENVVTRREQFRRFPDERLPIDKYTDTTQEDKDKSYVTQGAFLDGFEFDWLKYRVPKKTVDSTDIVHWLTYEVAQIALNDAGYTMQNIPKDKTGVILGNTLTGEETRISYLRQRWPYVARVMESAAKDLNLTEEQTKVFVARSQEYYKSVFLEMTEDSLAGGLANTIAGRVCNTMDLHGGGYTVDGACSSSLIAVLTAAEKLSAGTLDLAITGGVDVSLDTFEMVGFARTGALTPDKMRVYDKRGNGFMPGEGCGLIVMKRLEDARRDGDAIYAIIKGWGMSSDGKGSITAPNGKYQGLALQRAYGMAGYSATELDFIEGHGTGTTVGDREELRGIALNIGSEPRDDFRRCGLTSFKSICGHTKAASGIAGLIKVAISLNQRVIPPTAGCEYPNPFFFEPDGQSMYPIMFGEVFDKERILRAGVSAMGFGGINTHITLESADAPLEKLTPDISVEKLLVSRQKSEIYPLAADSKEALLSMVKKMKQDAFGMSVAELPDLAATHSKSLSSGSLRAIIVAKHPFEFQKSLEMLIAYLETSELMKEKVVELDLGNVLLSWSLEKPTLGFIYPGQGSQQLNMAHVLVQRFDWAKQMLDEADEILKKAGWEAHSLRSYIYKFTDKAFDETQKKEWLERLTSTNIAQPAICFASAVWTEWLKRLGLEASLVGGHSLGELSAFASAGAFDFSALISLANLRGTAMHNSQSKGSMLAVLGTLEKVESLLGEVDGYITIANINSKKQIVVSGENDAIDALIRLADEHEIKTKKLNVSNAFHSKLVKEASEILRKEASIPTVLEAKCPIVSSVSAKAVRPDIDMVVYFSEQVLSRVDFVGLVEEMSNSCDMLVEVGPGSVLSGMVSYIDGTILSLPVEQESMDDTSLNKVLSHYFVRGGDIVWDALYDSRLIRPFVPAGEKNFIKSACEAPFNLEPLPQTDIDTFGVVSQEGQNANASLENVIQTLQKIHDSNIIGAVNMLGDMNTASSTQTKVIDHTPKEDAVSITPTEEEIETESQEKPGSSKMKDVLLKKIEEMTGFPVESLDLDLKLLDDLNLDSIKATELIVETTEALGLQIDLDPSTLANATLQEIIDVLDEYSDGDVEDTLIRDILFEKIEDMTGFPEESLGLDLKLLDDLNLDSIKATELIVETTEALELQIDLDPSTLANATLQEIIDVFEEHRRSSKKVAKHTNKKTWVRNFIMTSVRESLDKESVNNIASNSKVLLISESKEQDVVDGIEDTLRKSHGVENISSVYFETLIADVSVLNEEYFAYIFTVLPREKTVDDNTEAVAKMVDRLSLLSGIKTDTKLCLVQFSGGVFATDHAYIDIEQSSAVAWASSLHLERDDLKIRVVDFDKNVTPVACANSVIAEVSTQAKFNVSSYASNLDRYCYYPEVHHSKHDEKSNIDWSSNDVILVTGGAKGITAECAIAFAEKTDVKMALVGSSSVPQEGEACEINMTLTRFREKGLEVNYYACDLVNDASVLDTLGQIESELGKITGVIHGSALNNPAPLKYVNAQKAKEEIAPKVLGAINILNHFKEKSLKMFASLTSIIGISGMHGNGWYGFSNELLDVLAAQYGYKHPETKVVSVASSVWGETGMGAKMGSATYLEKMGIMSIPTRDGVERFVDLLLKDAPAREVVIAAKLEGLDTWRARPLAKPYSHRYIENVVYEYPEVHVISQVHLDVNKDSYLKDHVWKDSNLFPTVFGLEAMAQVVAYMMRIENFKHLKIEDIDLERPIVVSEKDGLDIQIEALVIEDNSVESKQKIEVKITTEKSNFQTKHFAALFVLDGANGFVDDRDGLVAYKKEKININAKRDLYSWLLFQGPLFQRLDDFYQADNDLCIFDSNTEKDEHKQWMLGSPYVRDSLLQSVQPMVPEHSCLPVKIDALYIDDISQSLPAKIRGVSYNEALIDKEYRSSVYALKGDGEIYEKLEGYRLQIVEYRTEFPENAMLAKNIALREDTTDEEIDSALGDLSREDTVVEQVDGILEKLGKENDNHLVSYVPALSKMSREERHEIVRVLVEPWLKEKGIDVIVEWDDENKPTLDDGVHKISLSHSHSYLWVHVSKSHVGCDVEHVFHRSSQMWHQLLHLDNPNNQKLMQAFMENGESEDVAGTRLWTIRESIYKAIGEFSGVFKLLSYHDGITEIRIEESSEILTLVSIEVESKRGARMISSFVAGGMNG